MEHVDFGHARASEMPIQTMILKGPFIPSKVFVAVAMSALIGGLRLQISVLQSVFARFCVSPLRKTRQVTFGNPIF